MIRLLGVLSILVSACLFACSGGSSGGGAAAPLAVGGVQVVIDTETDTGHRIEACLDGVVLESVDGSLRRLPIPEPCSVLLTDPDGDFSGVDVGEKLRGVIAAVHLVVKSGSVRAICPDGTEEEIRLDPLNQRCPLDEPVAVGGPGASILRIKLRGVRLGQHPDGGMTMETDMETEPDDGTPVRMVRAIVTSVDESAESFTADLGIDGNPSVTCVFGERNRLYREGDDNSGFEPVPHDGSGEGSSGSSASSSDDPVASSDALTGSSDENGGSSDPDPASSDYVDGSSDANGGSSDIGDEPSSDGEDGSSDDNGESSDPDEGSSDIETGSSDADGGTSEDEAAGSSSASSSSDDGGDPTLPPGLTVEEFLAGLEVGATVEIVAGELEVDEFDEQVLTIYVAIDYGIVDDGDDHDGNNGRKGHVYGRIIRIDDPSQKFGLALYEVRKGEHLLPDPVPEPLPIDGSEAWIKWVPRLARHKGMLEFEALEIGMRVSVEWHGAFDECLPADKINILSAATGAKILRGVIASIDRDAMEFCLVREGETPATEGAETEPLCLGYDKDTVVVGGPVKEGDTVTVLALEQEDDGGYRADYVRVERADPEPTPESR